MTSRFWSGENEKTKSHDCVTSCDFVWLSCDFSSQIEFVRYFFSKIFTHSLQKSSQNFTCSHFSYKKYLTHLRFAEISQKIKSFVDKFSVAVKWIRYSRRCDNQKQTEYHCKMLVLDSIILWYSKFKENYEHWEFWVVHSDGKLRYKTQ